MITMLPVDYSSFSVDIDMITKWFIWLIYIITVMVK